MKSNLKKEINKELKYRISWLKERQSVLKTIGVYLLIVLLAWYFIKGLSQNAYERGVKEGKTVQIQIDSKECGYLIQQAVAEVSENKVIPN